MKNKFMQIALGTIFGLLMLIGSAQLLVSGQEKETQERSRGSLVGTWQTLVTQRNCATGVPVAPAFPGILTFNRGGTLTGTSTAVSSVYGVWEHENGWQDFDFAFDIVQPEHLSARKRSAKPLKSVPTADRSRQPAQSKFSTRMAPSSETAVRLRPEHDLNNRRAKRRILDEGFRAFFQTRRLVK
jgi:hypothetical protein